MFHATWDADDLERLGTCGNKLGGAWKGAMDGAKGI